MRDNRSGRWHFNVKLAAPERQELVVTGRLAALPDDLGSNTTDPPASLRCRCRLATCQRPDSDAVSELTATIWRASNTLSGLMGRQALSALDLNWEQWELLRYVCEHDETAVGSCADRLGIGVARVFDALAALSRMGLVRLRSVRGDVSAIVVATGRGRSLVPATQQRIANLESALLCPLKPAHVWAVEAVLERLVSNGNTMAEHLRLCRART
jgi:DNA-binding MarR family transcriptional regulator